MRQQLGVVVSVVVSVIKSTETGGGVRLPFEKKPYSAKDYGFCFSETLMCQRRSAASITSAVTSSIRCTPRRAIVV